MSHGIKTMRQEEHYRWGHGKERRQYCGPLKFKRIRVYFKVIAYDALNNEGYLFTCAELTANKAETFYKKCLANLPSGTRLKLCRIQTGGTIGGIILSGSFSELKSEVVK